MDPTNPTQAGGNVNDLPPDAVAILVWRRDMQQALPVVVSRASYDMLLKCIMDNGGLNPERTYELESLTNPEGRKTRFFFHGVVGVCANFDTGIVPVKVDG